jgi:hypothetical protein
MSASLIGQLGSSAFQAIHLFSVDVARGLSLLFGIGTKDPSIIGFGGEAEQSLGRSCRQSTDRSKRTWELTPSIVAQGTSFHCSVELKYPHGPRFTISRKRSTQNLQPSTSCRPITPSLVSLAGAKPDIG